LSLASCYQIISRIKSGWAGIHKPFFPPFFSLPEAGFEPSTLG
jgi:hypothetical protein